MITKGIADGDQVIVSGLQKVHPGAPAKAVAAQASAAERSRAGSCGCSVSRRALSRRTDDAAILHRSPGIRLGDRHPDHRRWPPGDLPPAGCGVSRTSPRLRSTSRAVYPGANADTVEQAVTQVIEQQLTGINNLLYFTSSSSSNGGVLNHAHLRAGHGSRHRGCADAEPCGARRAAPADRSDSTGRHGLEGECRLPARHRHTLRGQLLQLAGAE